MIDALALTAALLAADPDYRDAGHLGRFPPAETVAAWRELASARLAHLEARRWLDQDIHPELPQLAARQERTVEAYWLLGSARAEWWGQAKRATAARRLCELLGPRGFWAGRLPLPLPEMEGPD